MSESVIISQQKRNTQGELILVLFEQCNLSCRFCYQDHNNKDGMDKIRDKLPIVQQSIGKLQSIGKENIILNIMGGEVFSDNIPDTLFDDYEFLVNEIRKFALEKNIQVNINFVSNLVLKNKKRIENFLTKNKVGLVSSYDPSGRFNINDFETFKFNVKYFKDHLRSIGVVMTTNNIKKFLDNKVPFFDYIYENFETVFDHYTPEIRSTEFNPSDIELRNFAIKMVKDYPNSMPFKDYLSNEKKKMSCMDTLTIDANGHVGFCTNPQKDTKKTIPIKIQLENKWVQQYDCFSCEYFQKCSMGCFLNNHFREIELDDCWLKEVYREIEKNVY